MVMAMEQQQMREALVGINNLQKRRPLITRGKKNKLCLVGRKESKCRGSVGVP
jgi:hypothetical protein